MNEDHEIIYEQKEHGFSWEDVPRLVPAVRISKEAFEEGKKYFPDDYRRRKIVTPSTTNPPNDDKA